MALWIFWLQVVLGCRHIFSSEVAYESKLRAKTLRAAIMPLGDAIAQMSVTLSAMRRTNAPRFLLFPSVKAVLSVLKIFPNSNRSTQSQVHFRRLLRPRK